MSARYEVEGVLGRGAMGVVYRARPIGVGGRAVAYKRVVGDDPLLVERLRREAAVLDSLEHPHIIRIHELVEDETGLAIVMQYAGGGSLAERLATRGAVAPAEAATILIAVAEALECAHRAGVLHRDVKPSNILFTGDGHPLLSDFGVARRAGDAPLTDAGALGPATAEYLDPAVAAGRPHDARSDIYALAVVGYEMLAGRRPFNADHPLGVLHAADRATAAPLSDVAGYIPLPLASAVTAAMSRDPGDRPQTAAEFAAALRTAVAALPSVDARRHASAPVPAARTEPPTRVFGPRPPQPAAPDATPGVPWWRVAAAAAVLLVLPPLVVVAQRSTPPAARATVAYRTTTDAAPSPAPAPAPERLPACPNVAMPSARRGWTVRSGDLLGTGCRSWVRHRGRILQVALPDGKRLRVGVGRRGDDILLGDWDCNGTDTAALYASATGVVYEFSTWPEPGRRLRSSSARSTGVVGGGATIASSTGGCDEVAVVPALGT